MVTFIICVKHYENCYSYSATWKLLENTLVSVCSQTDKNFDVVVVSNKTLDNFSNNPMIKNTKFIEVDWDPPAPSNSWQIETQTSLEKGLDQARIDKGSKYILAMSQVVTTEKNETHYVMFVDADDYVHEKLAEYINNSDKDFLKIKKGFRLGEQNTYSHMDNFDNICGTCNITKLFLLKEQIDFHNINIKSPQRDILQSSDDYYLKMILGAHKWSFKHFEDLGYKKGEIPFRAAIYNCSHGEQHSGRPNNILEHKCTEDMIKEFNIKQKD